MEAEIFGEVLLLGGEEEEEQENFLPELRYLFVMTEKNFKTLPLASSALWIIQSGGNGRLSN